jgi:hypothetical protein
MNSARMTTSALAAAVMMGSMTAGCAVDATDTTDTTDATGATHASGGEQTAEAPQAFESGVAGELVAYGGRCLDLQGGVLGNQVQIFNCSGGSNQEWTLGTDPEFYVGPKQPSNGALEERSSGDSAGVTVAAFVQNLPSQLWTMPTVQIAGGASGLCMVPGGAAYNNQVIVEPCSGASWTFDESNGLFPIQATNGQGCLTASGTGASGSTLFVEPCGLSTHQNWTLVSGGTIRQGNLCADIRGGGGAGTAVQVFNCNGGSNQSWRLSGQLVSVESNRCVSLPVYNNQPDTGNATAVEMSTCLTPPAAWQTWTYKW